MATDTVNLEHRELQSGHVAFGENCFVKNAGTAEKPLCCTSGCPSAFESYLLHLLTNWFLLSTMEK
jgi:hypothetical protein